MGWGFFCGKWLREVALGVRENVCEKSQDYTLIARGKISAPDLVGPPQKKENGVFKAIYNVYSCSHGNKLLLPKSRPLSHNTNKTEREAS